MGRTPNVRLQYAGCLYRCGAVAAAEGVLTLIEGADSSLQAKIDHLLAEIYENLKNYRAAISYYQRVAINPSVELVTKWAALERLNSIRKMA
jgi:hypothetical protein